MPAPVNLLCPAAMTEARLSEVLARIERGLLRIEAAAGGTGAGSDAKRALNELEGRHQALRETARQAITEMDSVLAQVRGAA